MKAIACIDTNLGIAKDNKLLFHIDHDMRRFKHLTTAGGVVLMGYNTFKNDMKFRPLPNRINIVITSTIENEKNYPGVTIVKSVEEAMELVTLYESLGKEVFLIGGRKVYESFLKYCTEIYITLVDAQVQADTWFPASFSEYSEEYECMIDRDETLWCRVNKKLEFYTDNKTNFKYSFLKYKRCILK